MRALLPFVFLCGCNPQMPGEPVGTFDVIGELQDNTCGPAAIAAVDTLRFAVEIREEHGVPYWWRKGEVPITGDPGDEEHQYVFTMDSQARLLPSDPRVGHPGCTMLTHETVAVTLQPLPIEADGGAGVDAGVDAGTHDEDADTPLIGENTADLSPAPGTDCTLALAAFGGPYLTLPCRVSYTLEGSRRSPF